MTSIDHIVMPVSSLEMSSAWFSVLGFLVAPEALHPFGTKNACIFFAEGPYIEPLAVADEALCKAEARNGNVFVARDAAYRFRRGVPGFSAIAFRSHDAAGDLEGFREAGLADGPLFSFSRTFRAPDGETRDLAFRLAFAADRRAPDIGIFACEFVGQGADRSALTRHPNGALAIRRVVMSEPVPSDFAGLFETLLAGAHSEAEPSGISLMAGETALDILTPTALAADYGGRRHGARGPLIDGLVVAIRDLQVLRHIAAAGGIALEQRGARLVARLGGGTASFVAFEEETSR